MRFLFFVVFTGLGLMLLAVGIREYAVQRRLMADPRRVEALVIRSEVRAITSRSTDDDERWAGATVSYRPEIRFSYSLNDKSYESELLRPTSIGRDYASRSRAAAEIARFPKGSTVSAYVNPAMPDKAYLVREAGSGPLVFIAAGVLVPVANWFLLKLAFRRKRSPAAPGRGRLVTAPGSPFPSTYVVGAAGGSN